MSPAQDLVLWEIRWRFEEIDDVARLIPYCAFCPWKGEGVEVGSPSTAGLLAASDHECANHEAALRHVLYRRGGDGEPFTPPVR